MTPVEELKKIIKGDVLADEETLKTYSRDASLFVIKPQVVVFPKDVEDVKNLVGFVRSYKKGYPTLSLTGRSAGTDMSGGPLSESIVMSFTKYFNHFEVDPKTKRAKTQPGVYYRDFEKETVKHNLLMPPYPASRDLCAMGGIVNNNSAGEKTLEYGQAKNFVEKVKIVLSDGNEYELGPLTKDELEKKMQQKNFEGDLYRKMFALISENDDAIKAAQPKVSKNSAGYLLWDIWNKEKGTFDLSKAIVGAQGTLGMVTEATFRLVDIRPNSQMIILFLDDLSNLGNLVNTVLARKPSTFESYDDKTLKLAVKFFWEFIKRLGVWNIFSIAWNARQESFSILKYGFPKMVLQITFDGEDRAALRDKAKDLEKELVEKYKPRYIEVIKSDIEAQEYWKIRRESFGLLRHKIKDKKTAPFIDDIIVPPDRLPEFLPKLEAIMAPYAGRITYTVAGHIGNGNFHIIPLMNLEKEEQRKIIPELADKVYNLVLEFGGSTTAEHNDGLVRGPYLKQMFGEKIYKLFEETKRIFDPDNIFNPGKKIGVDKEYALAHIRRD